MNALAKALDRPVTVEYVTENIKDLPAEALIELYLADKKRQAALKEKWAAENSKYAERLQKLSGAIQEILNAQGGTSIRTKAGTAYTKDKTTASLSDPDAFMKHVIRTGEFDMLDRKANANAVLEYAKKHGDLPPGVNITTISLVYVNSPRAGAKLE